MKQRPAEIEERVELTPEELAELDERIAAVERGEFVDGDEVLRRLRSGYYAMLPGDLHPVQAGPIAA